MHPTTFDHRPAFVAALLFVAAFPELVLPAEPPPALQPGSIADLPARAILHFLGRGVDGLSAAIVDFHVPEGMQKFWNIFTAPPMGRMFRPGDSRYGWKWMLTRYDVNRDGILSRDEFAGSDALFQRLDRNRDGVLTAADFDWSDQSPIVRQANQAAQVTGKIDQDGNGQISAEEWQALFARAAKTKGYLNQQDLQELFYPLAPARPARPKSDLPIRWQRLTAFLRGETGNFLADGPMPGKVAPDLSLKTHDGSRTMQLSQFRGKRPVVLVFGSFT